MDARSARTVMDILPIQTPRLLLRRFRPADLRSFQSYRSDATLARYQGWQPVRDSEARTFLSAQARQELGRQGEWLQVALTVLPEQTVVGDLGIVVVDGPGGVIEIGFTLAREFHGRGYATEAVRAVTGKVLALPEVRSVQAVTDSRNAAAATVLLRAGFQLESTRTAIFRGEECEEQIFRLTG